MSVKYEAVTEDDLSVGDEVAVEVAGWFSFVKHHGIVVEGNRVIKIVSFTSDSWFSGGEVVKQDVGQFTRGKNLYRVVYPAETQLNSPDEVQTLIDFLVKNPLAYGEYNLWYNNCMDATRRAKVRK